MQKIFTVALPILATVTTSTATLPSDAMTPKYSIIKEFTPDKTAIRQVAPEKPKEQRLVCKGCNKYESTTLAFLQDRGITDKNALATIMGNIRQESTFFPNICEGGARVQYHHCRSGGFGIAQWTSIDRYKGLGKFAARTGGNPSTIDTQLQYMITEPQWLKIEDRLKVPGRPIEYYMRLAYTWLGWGHKGARTTFAYNYADRMIPIEVVPYDEASNS